MENDRKIIYADHSATTYVKEEVLDEMLPYFKENFGNPSSNYVLGIKAKEALEDARCSIANIFSVEKDEIYFTSGGSESNNMIIKGIARKNKYKGKHIIISRIEHLSVINTCKELENEGFEISMLNVDKNGMINLKELIRLIRKDTILISVMCVNNEIGTIEPIQKIASIAKSFGILFHTDAVQAVGNVKLNVKELGVDAMSISAHKFYGPKGVGAAYISKNVCFSPLINGGHQEKSLRAGTENVAGIVGMKKALEIATKNLDLHNEKMKRLRDSLYYKLKSNLDDIYLNGSFENRTNCNLNLYIKGVDSKTLILLLNMNGICISGGSACNTNSKEPSHVLTAIGLGKDAARQSIRITLGEENEDLDINYMAYNIIKIVKKIRGE